MYHILCVEDEPDFREDIADFLRMQNYEIVEAGSGEQALQLLQAGLRPDLILCDIIMPDMDGHDLLRAMRRLDGDRQLTPFVFLSALSDKETLLQGKYWGCDEYLTKPIDFDVLLATVRGRIERQRAADYMRESVRQGLNSRFQHFLSEEMYMPFAELAHSCTQLCEALPDDAGMALIDKAGRMRQRSQTHAMRARKLSELMSHTPLHPGPSQHRADDCSAFATQIALRVFGAEARHQLHMDAQGAMPNLPLREVTLAMSMLIEAAHTRSRQQMHGLAMRREGEGLTIEIADRAGDLKDEDYSYVALAESTDLNALTGAMKGRVLAIMYAERLAMALGGSLSLKIIDRDYTVIRLQLPEMQADAQMGSYTDKNLAIENHYH